MASHALCDIYGLCGILYAYIMAYYDKMIKTESQSPKRKQKQSPKSRVPIDTQRQKQKQQQQRLGSSIDDWEKEGRALQELGSE